MPASQNVRPRPWGLRSKAGGAAVSLLLVTVAPAAAEASGTPTQLPSNEAVNVVAGQLDDLGAKTGLAGITVDEGQRLLTVHWKGAAPADARAFIAGRPLGVSIQLVEGARSSRVEAMAAAQRLADSALGRRIGLQSVAVNVDGSGVRARVPGTLAPLSATDRSAAATVAGTGVTFETRAPAEKAAARYNDTPPWKGGIRVYQDGSACSTAFAVLSGSAGRLLSAHHCDESANSVVTDGGGQVVAPGGASVSGIADIDSQLIDPSASPATTPRIYTGGWNSSTLALVKGSARNFVDNTVCTSGATSGQHCGKVTDDTVTSPGTSGNFYIEAKAASNGVMVAGGDSGGAVFATVTGGVQARGVILAGAGKVTCGATNPDVTNPPCYNTLVYAPISVVLSTWGVQLEVG